MFKKDIKIVEFSATPDGTVYDINGWGWNSEVIKMHPGYNYVGAHDLLLQEELVNFMIYVVIIKIQVNITAGRLLKILKK